MYGYERSIPYPWGHRNVIWTERGIRTFPTTRPPEAKGAVAPAKKKAAGFGAVPAADDTLQLYKEMRKTGGIVTLHTSATEQGTDWATGYDPDLEPLVELWQGYHTAYESADSPLSMRAGLASTHGQYRPAGHVQNALAKGYRLGFQASSDHISTHVSYTCLYAESLDRKSLVEAMKARHAYAATDNIILDVRSGPHMMGDQIESAGPVQLKVEIEGTAPLAVVQVIRDNKVVYNHDGAAGRRARFEWTDMESLKGRHYYYVRVQQVDRQMAWGSPLWVTGR